MANARKMQIRTIHWTVLGLWIGVVTWIWLLMKGIPLFEALIMMIGMTLGTVSMIVFFTLYATILWPFVVVLSFSAFTHGEKVGLIVGITMFVMVSILPLWKKSRWTYQRRIFSATVWLTMGIWTLHHNLPALLD